jgi:nucleoside-diphosphate-sugar epimerase
VRWLRRGVFLPVGRGVNRRTLVYEEDVASAALLAAVHAAAAGRIYNVTDGEVHTFREIAAVICDVLDRRPPSWHVPIPWRGHVLACWIRDWPLQDDAVWPGLWWRSWWRTWL